MRLGREAGAMWSCKTWPSTRLLAKMLAFDPIIGFLSWHSGTKSHIRVWTGGHKAMANCELCHQSWMLRRIRRLTKFRWLLLNFFTLTLEV